MSCNTKIQINLHDGSLLVEAPAEALDAIFKRLESFLPQFIKCQEDTTDSINQKNNILAEDPFPPEARSEVTGTQQQPAPIIRKKRGSGHTKPESYKSVDLNLTHDQRLEFKEFYQKQHPSNQSDQVLVLIYWLTKVRKSDAVTKEEIFTGYRTVGEKTPTRISSVLSNLRIDGKVLTNDGKAFFLHHTGEDYVTHDMSAKSNKK